MIDKNDIRNVRFGMTISKNEKAVVVKTAKKHKLSMTDLFIRAMYLFNEQPIGTDNEQKKKS